MNDKESALINQLEAENEYLKQSNKELCKELNDSENEIQNKANTIIALSKENDQLKAIKNNYSDAIESLLDDKIAEHKEPRDSEEGKGTFEDFELNEICVYDEFLRIIGCARGHLSIGETTAALQSIISASHILLSKCNDVYTGILDCGHIYENGNAKWGKGSWKQGLSMKHLINSIIRHYCKCKAGWKDEQHLGAVLWNMSTLVWMIKNKPEMNDFLEVNNAEIQKR